MPSVRVSQEAAAAMLGGFGGGICLGCVLGDKLGDIWTIGIGVGVFVIGSICGCLIQWSRK
jgi:hypothetical protein